MEPKEQEAYAYQRIEADDSDEDGDDSIDSEYVRRCLAAADLEYYVLRGQTAPDTFEEKV